MYMLFKYDDGIRLGHYVYHRSLVLTKDAFKAWNEFIQWYIIKEEQPTKDEWENFSNMNVEFKLMKGERQ